MSISTIHNVKPFRHADIIITYITHTRHTSSLLALTQFLHTLFILLSMYRQFLCMHAHKCVCCRHLALVFVHICLYANNATIGMPAIYFQNNQLQSCRRTVSKTVTEQMCECNLYYHYCDIYSHLIDQIIV